MHVWYDVGIAARSLLVVALGLLVGYEFSSKSCKEHSNNVGAWVTICGVLVYYTESISNGLSIDYTFYLVNDDVLGQLGPTLIEDMAVI